MSSPATELRRKVKSYLVLGDEEDLCDDQAALGPREAILEAPAAVPPPVALPTVHTASPNDFPPEIWEAATRCSDQGAAVLGAYQELAKQRESYREQLSTLRFPTRRLDGTDPASSTLLKSGKQLWSPPRTLGSKRGASTQLPPLTALTDTALQQLNSSPGTATGGSPALSHTQRTSSNPNPLLPGDAALLGQMTVTAAVKSTRELRNLSLYDEQQGEWAAVEAGLAAYTRRPVTDLAMHRGPEHRAKQETLEALARAMPLADRPGGTDKWNMSLRNAWERVVPLGSLFSGLTLIVRESPPIHDVKGSTRNPADRALIRKAHERLMRVGRPLSSLGGTAGATAPGSLGGPPARSLTHRGRDWGNSETLRARLEQYADALNKQWPHKPDMPALVVTGQSLAAMLEASLAADITLAEVVTHLEAGSPAAAQEVAAVWHQLGQEAAAADAAMEEAQASAAANDAVTDAALSVKTVDRATARLLDELRSCQPGIHVTHSPRSLLLNCDVGTQASATVTLHNRGTVALQYTWRQASPPPHPLVRTPGGALPAQAFFALQLQGVLLPGEQHTARLIFRPPAAGVFSQTWTLATVPDLPKEHAPLAVQVQGMAVQPPSGAPQRAALVQRLDEAEKAAKVHAALERILHDVTPQFPVPAPELEADRLAAEKWDAANASAWPPLYWPGNAVQEQLQGWYASARAALVTALRPPPPPDSGKKGPAQKSGKGAPPPESPPLDIPWPEVWTSSVADLQGVLQQLAGLTPPAAEDAAAATTTEPNPIEAGMQLAQALAPQLEAVLASRAVRVPTDARVLMRHAARAGLGRVADLVEAKAMATRADFEQRVAEAAAAAEANSPGAPEAPTAHWLSDKTRAGAKSQIKGLVGCWWDEVAREKAAIAEWLAGALERLGDGAGSSGEVDSAALHWARFDLLRCWVRLGLPARPNVS